MRCWSSAQNLKTRARHLARHLEEVIDKPIAEASHLLRAREMLIELHASIRAEVQALPSPVEVGVSAAVIGRFSLALTVTGVLLPHGMQPPDL
jgi:hypothetical protein